MKKLAILTLGVIMLFGFHAWAQQALGGGTQIVSPEVKSDNTFDYIGLFSAAIMPNDKVTSKVYSDIDGTLNNQMKNGYKLYWIGIGKADFLLKCNQEYRARLDKMGMKYVYRESEGGHTWTNCRTYLSEFAPLLFK